MGLNRRMARRGVRYDEMHAFMQLNFNSFGRRLAKSKPFEFMVTTAICTVCSLVVLAIYLMAGPVRRIGDLEARLDSITAPAVTAER